MTDPFQTRLRALSDAELHQYLENHLDYRTDAVEAALAELDRRNLKLSGEDRMRIRAALGQREAVVLARLDHSFVTRLGDTTAARLARIRFVTASMLAVGLGIALTIYLLATPGGANPRGLEPEDSKKYLRELEVFGGTANLLASQIRGAWNGLWHGRNLAVTVGGLTILLALAFWFIATRRTRDLDELQD